MLNCKSNVNINIVRNLYVHLDYFILKILKEMRSTINIEKTRFDTRLSKEQKEFFEHAANLGGFRSLTEFVIFSVQQQAQAIIEKHDAILISKKDKEVFFDEITNPQRANKDLQKAAILYSNAIAEK